MRALVLVLLIAGCVPTPASKANTPNPRPLAGSRWVMLLDGAAEAPTLEFGDAARANGFTGCNQWFAQVNRSSGMLRFDAIGMTRRACEAPAMNIERRFAESLENTRAAQVEGDVLTLTGENGEALARFERAS